MKTRIATMFIAAIAALGLSACGGNDDVLDLSDGIDLNSPSEIDEFRIGSLAPKCGKLSTDEEKRDCFRSEKAGTVVTMTGPVVDLDKKAKYTVVKVGTDNLLWFYSPSITDEAVKRRTSLKRAVGFICSATVSDCEEVEIGDNVNIRAVMDSRVPPGRQDPADGLFVTEIETS